MLNPRKYSLLGTVHADGGGYGQYLSATPWTKPRRVSEESSSSSSPTSAITSEELNIMPQTIQPATETTAMGNTEQSKLPSSKDLSSLSDLFSKSITLDENEVTKPVPSIPDFVRLEQHLPNICSNIHRILSSRQLEATYQNCLAADLKEAGVMLHSEVSINLMYKGQKVSSRRADLIVQTKDEQMAILELKAVPHYKLSQEHLKQLQFYMHHFGIKTGYLINFPHDYGFPDVAECAENINSEFRHEIITGSYNSVKERWSMESASGGNDATVQIIKVEHVDFEINEVDDASLVATTTSRCKPNNFRRVSFDVELDERDEHCQSASPTPVIVSAESSSSKIACVLPKDSTVASIGAGCVTKRIFGVTKKGQPCKVCIREQRFCKYHISQSTE